MMENPTSAWENIPSSTTNNTLDNIHNASNDNSTTNNNITRIPSNEDSELSKELQIKILSEKLDFAQKQLEEKDRQLEHYKQLVKTLKDVLADVTGRNRGAAPPVSLSLSTGAIANPNNSANVASSASSFTKGRPPPGFESQKAALPGGAAPGGNKNNNNSIKGRKTRSFHADAFGSSFHDQAEQQHALGSHLLSDEEDDHHDTLMMSSALPASSMLGSLVSPSSAPIGLKDDSFQGGQPLAPSSSGGSVKRDVDKIASWRRSSDEPFESSTESSSAPLSSAASSTTTTTPTSGAAPVTAMRSANTPSSGKTVTISSNPIMNSPRGLKKSVSHHSLSSFNSGNTSALSSHHTGSALIDRPLAPLRPQGSNNNNNASGTTTTTTTSLKKSPSQGGLSLSGGNEGSTHHHGLGSARGDDNDGANKLNKLKKSQSMTSVYTVLEENRLDLKFPELDQMVGQIYALSKYQQGCRFLQKKLDENNPAHTRIILNELVDHLMELMTDPFGNYLFSKLMEHCDESQREMIVNKILQDLLPTAFDMYGTQSMQKMMPFLTESQIDSVINALKPSSIALIKHNKANYLIQYCLDHLPQKHNQWIFDAVSECMEDVGRDRVGCVIVKRCIDHATSEQTQSLFAEICNKALSLVQDPFGNYVVQHVLDKFPHTEQAQKLIARLLGNITELCVQKFSSNVVEKCLQVSDAPNRKAILAEITESDMLPQLLNDRFANFVVQTALDVADPDDRQKLVKNILPHLGRHYSPYTKRLQKKILQV